MSYFVSILLLWVIHSETENKPGYSRPLKANNQSAIIYDIALEAFVSNFETSST